MRVLSAVLLMLCLRPAFCADWPTWRGPQRDGHSQETGLLKKWPEGGPQKIWTSQKAGLGYSSFSVVGDRLYTLGADQTSEYVMAFDANTGDHLWQTRIGDKLENGWGGGPRSTPTVAGDRILVLGGKGGLYCVSAADGAEKWSVEMTELGGEIPFWGYSESPLVDGDRVLCTPGGKQGTVVAIDLQSGDQLWQSADVTEKAHYSSLISVDHFGQQQYIQLTMSKVFGLDHDGRLLWEHAWPLGRVAVVPTPIYHDGHVYVTSGYNAGCMLIKIDRDNQVEKVYDNKNMKNHHGGVIRIGEHLYGYSDGRGWICQDLKSGEVVWGEKGALGKGAVALADNHLYCLHEQSGTCVLIDVSTDGWSEQGRFTIDPQTTQRSPKGKIWSHPVIANGRLYLRDQEIICCYKIAE